MTTVEDVALKLQGSWYLIYDQGPLYEIVGFKACKGWDSSPMQDLPFTAFLGLCISFEESEGGTIEVPTIFASPLPSFLCLQQKELLIHVTCEKALA